MARGQVSEADFLQDIDFKNLTCLDFYLTTKEAKACIKDFRALKF